MAHDWVTTSSGELGMDAGIGALVDEAFGQGDLPNLHSVLIARHGKLALERYYEGHDERWGQSLGEVVFGPAEKPIRAGV